MGLLNIFKKKKEVAQPENQEIAFSEFDGFISAQILTKTADVTKKAHDLCSSLPQDKQILLEKIKELEQAELNLEMIKRPKDLINTAKKHFITGVRNAMSKINYSPTADYFQLRSFHTTLFENLKNIQLSLTNHGRLIKFGYGNELIAVKRAINTFVSVSHGLEKCFGNESGSLEDYESIKNTYTDIVSNNQSLQQLKEKEKISKDQLKTLEVDIQKFQTELDQLKESDEFADYLILETEQQDLKKQQRGLEQQITQLLVPLQRTLKFYLRHIQLSEPTAKAKHAFITKCIDTPSSALEYTNLSVTPIFIDMKTKLEQGRYTVKDLDKTITMLDTIIKLDPDNQISKSKELEATFSQVEKKASESEIYHRLQKLEQSITQSQNNNKQLSEEIVELSNQYAELQSTINHQKQDLQQSISNTLGDQYKLIY